MIQQRYPPWQGEYSEITGNIRQPKPGALAAALTTLDNTAMGRGTGRWAGLDEWRYEGWRMATWNVAPSFRMKQWDFYCSQALPVPIENELKEWQQQVETVYILQTHGDRLNWVALTNAVRDIPKPELVSLWSLNQLVGKSKPWWLMHHTETLRLLRVEQMLDLERSRELEKRRREAYLEARALQKRDGKTTWR